MQIGTICILLVALVYFVQSIPLTHFLGDVSAEVDRNCLKYQKTPFGNCTQAVLNTFWSLYMHKLTKISWYSCTQICRMFLIWMFSYSQQNQNCDDFGLKTRSGYFWSQTRSYCFRPLESLRMLLGTPPQEHQKAYLRLLRSISVFLKKAASVPPRYEEAACSYPVFQKSSWVWSVASGR